MSATDPRAEREGICGVTKQTGGTEWICVRPVHDAGTDGNNRYAFQAGGAVYFPQADRHYFVNRWPGRSRR